MATQTASIEKVVRKVLDEELEQRNEATLEAIERMNRVLTEEVIPRLPEDEAGYEEEEPTSSNDRTRAMRARAQPGMEDPADEPQIPEDEDEPPLQTVPEAVHEALEALYASLTADQADALAELFTAIAEEPADEAEEPEAPPAERPTHRPPRPKARLAA
ncbi:MAG: hypothetical protein ACREUX_18800 [Burkholderiales bacterium]